MPQLDAMLFTTNFMSLVTTYLFFLFLIAFWVVPVMVELRHIKDHIHQQLITSDQVVLSGWNDV